MTDLSEPEKIKAFYEEQLESQRGMLSSAIDTLLQKKEELEDTVQELEKRNFEINRISDRTFHDMREPMVALLGLVQMLRDETESETAGYLLNLAESSVKKLNNFSLSLASYVRTIQEKFTLQEIEAKSFFEELEDSLKDVEGRDRVNLDFCDQSIAANSYIYYDREKLKLILKNLITNGIRFRDIEEKDPRVDIAFRVKGKRTIIMVRDNGMGISEAVLKNVTEMFYRGSGKSNGVGLGLYMVKSLLETSDDYLRIRSKEGQGTRVYVLLDPQEALVH